MTAVFFRLTRGASGEEALRRTGPKQLDAESHRFSVAPSRFREIPRSPFCYWASNSLSALFRELAPFEAEGRSARFGASTKEDMRFLRAWFETLPAGAGSVWVGHAKGGSYSPFYADLALVLNWRAEGEELKAFVSAYRGMRGWGAQWSGELKGYRNYMRPGLTWSRRSQVGLSMRAMPGGCIFGDKGPAAFILDDSVVGLLSALAVANSSTFKALVELQMSFGSYEVGVIQRTPFPDLGLEGQSRLAALACQGWSLWRGLDTVVEISHAFVMPALSQVEGLRLSDRVQAWSARVAQVTAELAEVQRDIDGLCFDLYGISESDRRAITEGSKIRDDGDDGSVDAEEEEAGSHAVDGSDPSELAAQFVSWAVGVGVGRFDVQVAIDERDWPVEPEPFDPLPVCSPGMLTGEDGLPLPSPPDGYPVEVSSMLVVDPGHPLDLTSRVRSVFEVVFGADADTWWLDAGHALSPSGGELSGWLGKGFFEHHLKTYSKSRRKAPVLWPLGTKSGSYLVWLYAHRVTGDSLFQVLHDIVQPKVALEEQRLTNLRQSAGPSPSASQRREIDKQATLVDELREFAEGIEAVTPLWAPDLNDGIVIVLAPLWRLFAHHRAWSRQLKSHWGKLAAGDYDWAHLAMHLWPERVIPKCAKDRSLAIAHGLEEVFWVQDGSNPEKWHARRTPLTPVDELIAQHHNPATSAALDRLAP